MHLYNMFAGTMASQKSNYMTLTAHGEEDSELRVRKRPARLCSWIIIISLVLAVLVIIALSIALGVTAQKVKDDEGTYEDIFSEA